MIKYKIVEVHPSEHSIVVRFFTDKITEAAMVVQTADDGTILRCRTDYNVELPVPAPTGAALDAFIQARAPVDWLTTQEKVADPLVDTSLTGLQPLLNVVKGFEPAAPATAVAPPVTLVLQPKSV